MFRTAFIAALSLTAFVQGSGVRAESSPGVAAAQPNVIVIISDDAGWVDFGFQDQVSGVTSQIPTPRLDELAAGGVTFSNAYTASVCSPSRAMLTTGMYGGRFGYESNIANATGPINSGLNQGLPVEVDTIWEKMQSVGYATAAVGKWHIGAHTNNGSQLGNRPQNQGVESFEGLIGGSRSFFVGSATGTQELISTISDGAGSVASNQSIENQYSGEYVTDVFGDLTVDYIRDNHDGSQPFFMYSSFTAPHTPLQATDADLNDPRIAGLTGDRKIYAAMQLALDRNVGKIMDALDDPNGDGNTSDSIADNTLVVFLNDNGGDCCDGQPNASRNGPLRNGKGSQSDGGLRIPFIVAGAGVDPSVEGTVYDAPVHAIDVLPTAFEAGGGVIQPSDTIDGQNLLPFINGTAQGVPHENLYIRRNNNNQSAIRSGDWKLQYRGANGFFELYNLANDIGESNNVAAQNPEIVAQLQRAMTDFDVQMDKARVDNRASNVNQFDEFRFRESAFAVASWSTPSAWTNNQGGGNATMDEQDSYAGAVLVFQNRPQGDYTATNDLTRIGGLPYLANRIELVDRGGALTGDGKATINGRGVTLTKTLDGVGPQIRLDSAPAGEATYTYELAIDIDLYDDLEIVGDGTEEFQITGAVREYRPGRNVTKTGSAPLTLGGVVDLSGTLDLQGGRTAFTNGQVRGDVIARSGTVVRVGGVGIQPETPGVPPPDLVTAGLDLNYDAELDAPANSTWEDAALPPSNLNFGGSPSPVSVNSAEFPALSAAYSIPAAGIAGGPSDYFEGSDPRSKRDATFELVFNVTNTSAGSDQVLLEAGGVGRGVAVVLNDSTLTFNVDGESGDLNINTPVATGWRHLVGVIDLDTSTRGNDSIALYLDNQFIGSIANEDIFDWAGGNPLGLGGGVSSVTGVSSGTGNPFHGEIAIARYYTGNAFDAGEVAQNYQWLLVDEDGTPGTPAVTLALEGAFTQEAGSSLELDLLSTSDFDRVQATADAQLAGGLMVTGSSGFSPAAGDAYEVISASSVSGEFESLDLPQLTSDLMWQVDYGANSVTLRVTLAGDYNGDGIVNAADYTVWRDTLGQTVDQQTGADGDGDGVITLADYETWRNNYGMEVPPSPAAQTPEPTTLSLSVLIGVAGSTLRSR
ncbi:MAG: sulfatase-like hydrolase/transferase [Planctomycetota bacterium]